MQQLAAMVLFRSLTVGMLGACLYLLWAVRSSDEPPPSAVSLAEIVAAATAGSVAIVDVSAAADDTALLGLIRLAPEEQVIAVDGEPAASNLVAGALIRERVPGTGGYLDLAIRGPEGPRRLLVLRH